MLAESSSVAEKCSGQQAGEKPRYRLVSRIAVGSTAELFLAVMPGACDAAKPVVIKMLWPELARDAECVRQFLDEARLSLQLHHPNVLHCYESGFDGARYFLTMEYLDGQSLKHLLDKLGPEGGLSLPLSLKIISDVLAALEYVHALTDLHGTPLLIVHRDASPQNVLVTYDGAVKLVDFGIAQTAVTTDRTAKTGIEGRMAYMSPEQAAGQTIDHRSDIFSVGVMLWEVVMGRRLWQGLPDEAIKEQLLSGSPIARLPSTRGFPPGLATICDRALAISPSARYACASDFQADLSMVLTGSAPVQSRLIGEMVSRLFASERALVRSMMKQSLPPTSSERKSGSQAVAVDVAPSAVPRSAQGSSQSEGSVLYDRHARSSISMQGEDVTLVNPTQAPSRMSTRRALAAMFTTVVLGVLAGGLGLSHILSRTSTALPLQPLAITTSPSAATVQPPQTSNVASPWPPAAEVPEQKMPVKNMPNRRAAMNALKRTARVPNNPPQRLPLGNAGTIAVPPKDESAKELGVKQPTAEVWELPSRKTPLLLRHVIDRDNPYIP